MKPTDFLFDPTALAKSVFTAQLEMAQDFQKLWLRQLDTLAKEGAAMGPAFKRVDVPVPVMMLSFDETRMRELWHTMADANLSAWSRLAEVTKAMPGWTKWAQKAPGEFWSSVFDRMNGFDASMAANDTMQETARAAAETAGKATTAAAEIVEKVVETAEDFGKPLFLDAPKGKPDDLTRIKGIGAKLSALLNELGIYHYAQIASWTPENCAWIDDRLSFKGRVQREAWVDQAASLAREAA